MKDFSDPAELTRAPETPGGIRYHASEQAGPNKVGRNGEGFDLNVKKGYTAEQGKTATEADNGRIRAKGFDPPAVVGDGT